MNEVHGALSWLRKRSGGHGGKGKRGGGGALSDRKRYGQWEPFPGAYLRRLTTAALQEEKGGLAVLHDVGGPGVSQVGLLYNRKEGKERGKKKAYRGSGKNEHAGVISGKGSDNHIGKKGRAAHHRNCLETQLDRSILH